MSTSTRSKRSVAASRVDEASFTLLEKWNVDACRTLLGGQKFIDHLRTGEPLWKSIAMSLHAAIQLDGDVPVTYTMRRIGRMSIVPKVTGVHVIPLALMKRDIRSIVCNDACWDIDIANCQPTILSQFLKNHGIVCNRLHYYVTHRDDVLSRITTHFNVDRDAAKNLILRLMYLGGIAKWMVEFNVDPITSIPDEIHELQGEFSIIANELSTRTVFNSAFTGHDESLNIASKLAIFLQTKERECIVALKEEVERTHTINSIIHDGMLVVKKHNEHEINSGLLTSWKRAIAQCTSYELDLTVKKMHRDRSWIDSSGTVPWMASGIHCMNYAQVKCEWEKFAFKIVKAGNYVVIDPVTSERSVMSERALIESYKHLHFIVKTQTRDGDIELNTGKSFIKKWTFDREIRFYRTMVFSPPPLSCLPDEFNIWTPFAVQTTSPPPPGSPEEHSATEGRDFILNFIHILCNRNTSIGEYLLDWIAQIFQYPAIKRGTAVLLKGEEGIGKNCLTDLLREMVGRKDKFMQTANPSSCLFGKFTQMREGKLLIVINESRGSDNHSSIDIIKDMITCDEFVCEGKNTNAYSINCFARFIFTTNNDNVMKLCPDSRRFLVIEGSSELKSNKEFFDKLVKHSQSPEVRRSLYDFLMARDISNKDWIGDLPETKFMKDLVSLNLPFEHQFIKNLVLRHHESGDRKFSSKSDVLFGKFRDWLSETNTAPKFEISAVKFGVKISKTVWNDETCTGLRGITKKRCGHGMMYAFETLTVIDDMARRKWMSSDELEVIGP